MAGFFVFLYAVYRLLYTQLNLFNLKEFDTTLTELKAMAAEANMGFRSILKKG